MTRQFLLEMDGDNNVRAFMFLESDPNRVNGAMELAYVNSLREAFIIIETQASVERQWSEHAKRS